MSTKQQTTQLQQQEQEKEICPYAVPIPFTAETPFTVLKECSVQERTGSYAVRTGSDSISNKHYGKQCARKVYNNPEVWRNCRFYKEQEASE